jgi:hypothetical protein
MISSSDPQALEKLNEKLEACQKRQTFMKDVNNYYRKNGTCKGAPNMSDTLAETIDRRIKTTNLSWETMPFPSYDLSNNNAEIKRLQNRIAEITRNLTLALWVGSLKAARQ